VEEGVHHRNFPWGREGLHGPLENRKNKCNGREKGGGFQPLGRAIKKPILSMSVDMIGGTATNMEICYHFGLITCNSYYFS